MITRAPSTRRRDWEGFFVLSFFLLLVCPGKDAAAGIRVLPEGQLPNDQRLQPLKDLNGYFPFHPSVNTEAWTVRAERVRRQLLVSLGLWPMPAKTPLEPVIHGQVDRGDYTVDKVYFQSRPGFYVTGSLYRPKNKSGKLPAVLSPHGHWANGRFYDNEKEIRNEIIQGAERFEEGGRSPLQARCVQLARMGCVVFHYDMIGYADSQQIPQSLAHGFAKQRPEMISPDQWGLFSPQAEAHLQSVMGLQTWNSIRALDFLSSLPDVDPARIAVTGASGGGTQTFILCALDPRPAVAFPAVMVSTAMQGGCTCENACDLRIDTGNVEFAALFAPKPLGLTAANDWTQEMESKGFPELQTHYRMLGAPDRVRLTPLLHFGHNYNYVSRAAMYRWLNQHLKLGFKEPIVEEDFQRLTIAEMTVWDQDHPQPPGGPDFERQLLRGLTEEAQTQVEQAAQSVDDFRRLAGGAMEIVVGRTLASAGSTELDLKEKIDQGNHYLMTGLLRNTTHGEELPVAFLHPKEWNHQTVIWIDPAGKSALFSGTGGSPQSHLQKLLDAGISVVGVDLLYQGEFLTNGQPVTQTRRVQNNREAAAYSFGYNDTLFARRVHDILTVIRFVQTNERVTEKLDLVGLAGAGPWVAAARAVAGSAVQGTVVDSGGFRFINVSDIRDVNFLPGGAKYGDLPGMLALAAPSPLFLAGEGNQAPGLIQKRYQASKADRQLQVFDGESGPSREAALRWLIGRR